MKASATLFACKTSVAGIDLAMAGFMGNTIPSTAGEEVVINELLLGWFSWLVPLHISEHAGLMQYGHQTGMAQAQWEYQLQHDSDEGIYARLRGSCR